MKYFSLLCLTDSILHQHFHTDAVQRSRGAGTLWSGPRERRAHTCAGNASNRYALLFVLFFAALAVPSNTRVSGSKSQVSQFNIRIGNKLHSASTGERERERERGALPPRSSRCSGFTHTCISNNSLWFQMDIDEEMSDVLYSKLLELEKVVRRKVSERNAGEETNVRHDGKLTRL